MKALAAVLVMMAGLAGYLACAHTGPDPCIGTYAQRQTMPCTCPGTLDPACAPWPNDDTKRPTDGGSR